MSHVAEGLLRRYLDEPASLDDTRRAHLASCQHCQALLDAAAGDRDAAAALLAIPAANTGADTAGAWLQLRSRLGSAGQRSPVVLPPSRPRRQWLRRPVVAVAAAAAVAIGTTAAAVANDWLPIFQPRQVSAVTFDINDFSMLPDLSAYGTLSAPRIHDPEPVASAAEAQARTGIDVPELGQLPSGVTGSPQYAVLPKMTAQFTFSAAKAREAAARSGHSMPEMPAGVDGSSLRVDAGPGVVTVWGASASSSSSSSSDLPELAIVRMPAPRASAQGVSLPTLRSYLLAQPGIPPSAVRQLQTLPDDGTVLPVPVPEQYATSEPATIEGVKGTLIELRDGSGAGLIWIKDGRLTVVAGLLSAGDIKDVAGALR